MEKIKLNGVRYIALGEFNHLRRNMVKDVYDRYRRAGDGKIHMSEFDQGYTAALHQIMTGIMYDEIHDAESPEEIKAMRRQVDSEFARHNFMIVAKDAGSGEEVFFRKYCEHIHEGEEAPVFTNMARLARTWSDHYHAATVAESLRRETGDESIRVVPAWTRLMPAGAEKRLLEAIFGEDKNEEPEWKSEEDKPVDFRNAWVIFHIDKNDNFQFFECLQHMEEIPDFIKRHMKKPEKGESEYAVVTTNDVGLATLYATEKQANAKIAEIRRVSDAELSLHTTTRKMFDDEDSIDALRMIFSDNPSKEPEYHGDGTKAEDEDWDGNDSD